MSVGMTREMGRKAEKLAAAITEYRASLPEPEFKAGDSVMLDNGRQGMVYSVDEIEGDVTVFYVDKGGEVSGPSTGWELELIRTPLVQGG